MRRTNYISEYERLINETLQDGKGVVDIDLSLHYPFFPHDITLGIGLLENNIHITLDDIEENKLDTYLFNDTVINHRFPNKDYFTLSRKVNKRVSASGYPVYAEIETINKYKYILIKVGEEQKAVYYEFPISYTLTKDNPIATASIMIFSDQQITWKYHTIEIDTAETTGDKNSAIQHRYHGGKYLSIRQKQDEETNLKLEHIDIDETKHLVKCETPIQLYPQSKEGYIW